MFENYIENGEVWKGEMEYEKLYGLWLKIFKKCNFNEGLEDVCIDPVITDDISNWVIVTEGVTV